MTPGLIFRSAFIPNTKIRQHPGTHSNLHTRLVGSDHCTAGSEAFQVGLNIKPHNKDEQRMTEALVLRAAQEPHHKKYTNSTDVKRPSTYKTKVI